MTKNDYLEWTAAHYSSAVFIQIHLNISIKLISESKMGTIDEKKQKKLNSFFSFSFNRCCRAG